MKIKIIAVLLTLSLSGCVYQTINSDEIALAQWYCADKEGVESMKEEFNGTTTFKCNEAFSKRYSEDTLKQKYLAYLKENSQ